MVYEPRAVGCKMRAVEYDESIMRVAHERINGYNAPGKRSMPLIIQKGCYRQVDGDRKHG